MSLLPGFGSPGMDQRMSREEQDLDYKPRTTMVKPVRSSRITRKVEPVDYSEAEIESDTDSETTLCSSRTTVVVSPMRRDIKIKGEQDWDLETLWTPGTLNMQARRVSEQFFRLTEKQIANEMAETNNLEKIMQMMLTLNQKQQCREYRREEERVRQRREEQERKERRLEREARLEERQAELLTQFKEALPVVPQDITIQQQKLPKMNEKKRLRTVRPTT